MATLSPLPSWRTAIAKARDLQSSEKLVAVMLSRYMPEAGMAAYPSRATLSEDCSLSVRTVQRCLNSLVEKGYLHRTSNRTDGRPSHYVPMMRLDYNPVIQSSSTGYPPDTGVTSQAQQTVMLPRGGVTQTSQGGVTPVSHELPPTEGGGEEQESSLRSLALRAENTTEPEPPPKKDNRAVFGALIDAMGRPPDGGESARWGRIAKLMAAEGVVPAEVALRAARYRALWPTLPLTPQALWNNWGRFALAEGEPRLLVADLHAAAEEIRRREHEPGAGAGGQGDNAGAPGPVQLPSPVQRPPRAGGAGVEGDAGHVRRESTSDP